MSRFRSSESWGTHARSIWRTTFESPVFWAAAFVLGVLLLFHLTVRTPRMTYSVGEVANRDLVLPRDLTVVDYQETEKRKIEAVEFVRPVFDWQPDKGALLGRRLTDLFAEGRRGLAMDAWTHKFIEGPEVHSVLRRYGFSTVLEDLCSGILLQVYRNSVVYGKKYLTSFYQKGFIRRNTVIGEEDVSFDVYTPLGYPEEILPMVQPEFKKDRLLQPGDRDILVRFMVDFIEPNLTLNAVETNFRRQKAVEAVPPLVYHLSRGYVLARQGDILSERTITILRALEQSSGFSRRWPPYLGVVLLGLGILIFLSRVVLMSRTHFYGYTPQMTFNLVLILFLIHLVLLQILQAALGPVTGAFRFHPLNDPDIYLYVIPYAAGTFLVRLLAGYALSVGFALSFSLVAAVLSPQFPVVFPFALFSSLAVIMAAGRARSRWAITRAGLSVGAANVFLLMLFGSLFQIKGIWPSVILGGIPLPRQILTIFWPLILAFLGAILSSAVVSFITPFVESVFGLTTDLRLVEFTNPNHPLLKELALKAPGTFQHSIQLAALAERAAEAIGANPLLARAACLFHDIGKLAKPVYFVENQRTGENPHEKLEPGASRLILKSHVQEGVDLARRHRLPRPIIDAILTHHGTKVMHYFYHKAMSRGENGTVQEGFRYPGPKPRSKEMSIILLADALEAAVRTLDEPSLSKLTAMVDTLVESAVEDGQLAESDLTFFELETVKQAFRSTLASMYHARVDYPGFDFNGD